MASNLWNEPAEVRVLGQAADLLLHIGGVDAKGFAVAVRRRQIGCNALRLSSGCCRVLPHQPRAVTVAVRRMRAERHLHHVARAECVLATDFERMGT